MGSRVRSRGASVDMHHLDILYIGALIFANGFFVAAEFALVKVRTSQIDQLAAEGHWTARLTSRALDRLDAYLSASQLGITVASLALGEAIHTKIQPAIERLFLGLGLPAGPISLHGVSIAIIPLLALSFVTFLHMALGEQAPKSLAIRAPRVLALGTAPVLVTFYYVFWPLIWLLNTASNLTLWCLGLRRPPKEELTHTEEELRHILGESVSGGALSKTERVMIENVLDLEAKTVRRVMVPRPDIVYLSMAWPLEDNLRLARQAGHTRYPLCESDLSSTVIGMIHVKDLFRAGGPLASRQELRKMARDVPFLSPALHLDALLFEFQRNRVHLAMVVDEFGSVLGMVTLENVLEELVGPIQDEFDRESPLVSDMGGRVYEVDAACPLDVLEDSCGVEVPETDAETVGGLVVDLLGRLARKGDSVRVGQHRVEVLRADRTRVRRVRVEPVPGPMAPEPSAS